MVVKLGNTQERQPSGGEDGRLLKTYKTKAGLKQ